MYLCRNLPAATPPISLTVARTVAPCSVSGGAAGAAAERRSGSRQGGQQETAVGRLHPETATEEKGEWESERPLSFLFCRLGWSSFSLLPQCVIRVLRYF